MNIMSSDYQVSWLSRFLNSLPRWDLTFIPLNSTFRPLDEQYRESLIIWAALPVLWLVITLLVFLMYFCVRCCQRDVEKKQRVPCLKWTMAILALFTIGVIGLGFYGNQETKKGFDTFATAVNDGQLTSYKMQQEVDNLQRVLTDRVDKNIDGMQRIFQEYVENHPDLTESQQSDLERVSQKSQGHTRSVVQSAINIQSRASKVNIGTVVRYTNLVGFWLWLGVIILLSCFVLLCLNLLAGIGHSSKCLLLLFCALGIIMLVMCWIAAGIFFGISIGVSDFCVDPNTSVAKFLTTPMKTYSEPDYNTPIDKEVVKYYLVCDNRMPNPFKNALQDAQDSVRQANNTINRAINIAINSINKNELRGQMESINSGLDETINILLHITALVECTNLHKDYTVAIKGVCNTALPGFAFLLLSTIVTGLLFTLLVLMASRAWRHFTRRKGYQEVDEDDPFLPRPDPNSPSYYRYASLLPGATASHRGSDAVVTAPLMQNNAATPSNKLGGSHSAGTPPLFTRQGARGNARAGGGEQITMQRRNTPPPANNEDYYNFHAPATPVVPPRGLTAHQGMLQQRGPIAYIDEDQLNNGPPSYTPHPDNYMDK